MRDLIDIVALLESTILIPTASGMNLVVTKNPTKSQFAKLKSNPDLDMKGLVDGNDLYIWSAYHAHHGQISHALGLENAIRIMVTAGGFGVFSGYADHVLNCRAVQYLYPNGDIPIHDE